MARTSKSYYVVDVGIDWSAFKPQALREAIREERLEARKALKANGLNRKRFRTKAAAESALAALDETTRARVQVFEQFDLDFEV